jgi:hypothetical protein
MLGLGAVVSATILALHGPLNAAELLAPSGTGRADFGAPIYCERCGCMSVAYARHRELRSTYGLSFDPRNYDTTEPHFYLGRMRAYPRYFVDGLPVAGSC